MIYFWNKLVQPIKSVSYNYFNTNNLYKTSLKVETVTQRIQISPYITRDLLNDKVHSTSATIQLPRLLLLLVLVL